jgi:ribosomal RNA assembly protein
MIEYIAIPEERLRILRKDTKWKEQFEEFTNLKIRINEEVAIEGEDPISILRAKEVFRAFGRSFEFNDAMNLLDEDYTLETVEIKHFAGKSKKRQIVLKGRVIGTAGITKKMIEKYSETKIAIYGKTISIMGRWKDVQAAKKAIEMLLGGAMHNTVYQFLENRKR